MAHLDQVVRGVVSVPPLAYLLVFCLLPSLLVLAASFRFPGEFGGLAPLFGAAGEIDTGLTFDNYRFVASDPIFAEVVLKSVMVAAATTLGCLLLAYPLALLIARSPQRRRDWMVLLVILPFAGNFLVRVYAWIIILGPLNLLYTSTAMMIGMIYVHLPFMILPLYTNLEKHDPLWVDAARDLGATRWQAFRRVTLPMSMPGVISGSALVFTPVLGMFAVPELLGGVRDVLVGSLIKDQFLDSRDWPFGATLAIVLALVVWTVSRLAAHLTHLGRDD